MKITVRPHYTKIAWNLARKCNMSALREIRGTITEEGFAVLHPGLIPEFNEEWKSSSSPFGKDVWENLRAEFYFMKTNEGSVPRGGFAVLDVKDCGFAVVLEQWFTNRRQGNWVWIPVAIVASVD